jgi:WhiB family redox-sensing transcriptional regulator
MVGLSQWIKESFMEWMFSANCDKTTQDLFFSKYKKEQDMAKEICNKCDVSLDCLKFAIDNECTSGIYGGLTPKEREVYATH